MTELGSECKKRTGIIRMRVSTHSDFKVHAVARQTEQLCLLELKDAWSHPRSITFIKR
jgi:hypothetical protein